MPDPLDAISSIESNFGLEGVNLMFKAEALHQNRLNTLESKQDDLNKKLSDLNAYVKKCYKHLKSDSKIPFDLSEIKQNVLALWNEWKESLKTKDPDEYKNLKVDLEKLDFSKMSLEDLDDKLIPELEKIQRHHEYQYQKIPNELRMFIELFTILVEILKEFPKKFAEINGHINSRMAR
ncbi:MAG: hypothetical protein WCG10_05975 [Chlamydiota bacterium]